jgi:DEAD/DEAH box helicase domain-containing protein
MNSDEVIDEFKRSSDYEGQIVYIRKIKEKEAKYGDLSRPLPNKIAEILFEMGIKKLYTHQTDAIENIRKGENVVIVTSTASGKTLCYNIPVIENLISHPEDKALYIFPTKALAQNQLKNINNFISKLFVDRIIANTYDGDTPQYKRKGIRINSSIILTNPDMLHHSILPNHIKWAQFLGKLKYIVIDEIHVYRGIFGSNTSQVLKRLNRIADYYGSSPQYICCSASIANPVELTEKLTGKKVKLIENDGAPKGEKTFVFWNPPVDKKRGNIRKSSNIQAQKIFTKLINKKVQTIVFARTRIVAELLYKFTKEYLEENDDINANAIRSYRGGYLPEERRKIEELLFNGKLLGITSTNALELGIDVGTLDACIIVGYPGSITSVWQQSGRAGRTKSDSLVVIVAYDDPIDQYFINHPSYFFDSNLENAVIDPFNPYIMVSHLCSAVYELPFCENDFKYFGPLTNDLMTILEDESYVKKIQDKWFWARGELPSTRNRLRTTSEDNINIIELDEKRSVIGTVDFSSAFLLVHPGAVYIQEGESYIVQNLDIESKIAYVRKGDLDYYTQPITYSTIKVLEKKNRKRIKNIDAFLGEIKVVFSVFSFVKIKFYSLERFGMEKLDLPEQEMETTSLWLDFSTLDFEYVISKGVRPVEGLVGIKNLLLIMLPILSMCDKNDIGGTIDVKNPSSPGVFIFDKYPGGIGFSEKGFELIEDMLRMGYDLVKNCNCKNGCPSCVGASNVSSIIYRDFDGKGGWFYPDKMATKILLEMIL